MNKKILFLLILIIMPLFVDAKTYTFNNGIQEGNGYINMSRFGDRNKYLLLYGNTRFIVNNNGTLAYEERFYNGGFLNYREFCLSTGNSNCSGKSYLVIPSPYWTCSGNSTNKYYINNVSGIDSKSDTNYYSIRVTEFVKPETTVSGIGTYTNPWYFYGNNYVSLSTNSKKYAYFNETNTNKIEKYADTSSCLNGSGSCVNFKMTVAHGYENNTNDGCGLKLYNRDKRMHHYEISNITSDIECVAIFVKKEFNISFDCNGGTGSIPSIKVIYNDNLVIPNQMCSKTGYTQNGWLTGSNENWLSGSTIKFQFDDGEQGINEKKLNLKAKWVANTYYVNYNGNGATGGSTGKTTHTYDTTSNLRANGFTRRGYIFAGWATSAGGGVVYGNNASIFNLTATPNETINLYAKWTPITYTITYNGNGATGGSTANTGHTYDVPANLRANGFSRTGYTFAGWATSAGGGAVYSNSQSVSNLTDVNGATVTLYAKWTANTYYINYNANGGWNAPGTTTYTYDAGSNTNLSSGVPSRDYYTFIGWSQSSGASSPSYSAGQAWWRGNASNYTLYAVWRKNHIITRYDMNGGSWAGSTEPALGASGSLITYNGDINAWIYDYDNNGILNLCNWNNKGYINIKRNDYTAKDGKQWCTEPNGGGTCYNHSTDYNFQNSFANVCNARYGDCVMTLYVNWEKESSSNGCDSCYCCCSYCPGANHCWPDGC